MLKLDIHLDGKGLLSLTKISNGLIFEPGKNDLEKLFGIWKIQPQRLFFQLSLTSLLKKFETLYLPCFLWYSKISSVSNSNAMLTHTMISMVYRFKKS